MKKALLKTLFILGIVIVVWVIAHQFDTGLNPKLFTRNDIPPASVDKTNGFYILWALTEPPDVDVTPDKYFERYRALFGSQYDEQQYIDTLDPVAVKRKYVRFQKSYNKLHLCLNNCTDLLHEVLSVRPLLQPLDPDLQVLCQRFRMMIDSKVFEDFTPIAHEARIPHLFAWIHAAKLYMAVNMLTALDGQWETGVSNLLDMVDFGKRAIKGSRYLVVNVVSKSILSFSLEAIASLMNQTECPASVYEMVLKRMPPLTYEEYGARKSLICEAVTFNFDYIDNAYEEKPNSAFGFLGNMLLKIFLVKNQTMNDFDRMVKRYIEWEQTPPYRWKADMVGVKPILDGSFWWVWNAGGKMLIRSYMPVRGNPNTAYMNNIISRTYRTKAQYDMVRIAAELHLKYEPGKPVQDVLPCLDSYKVSDPCSGQPYRWNDQTMRLFSIGVDRVDNRGNTNIDSKGAGLDYAIPVILH
ncbi:MAG: hypothetical protein ACM3SY_21550 [Candidatus Omnitrophota bacterium]